MAEQYISVKISGTPVRKGAFIPIVNINEAFFEISDTYPSVMSRDACVYTVSVLSDMTVYKLVFGRMRHHGDSAEARLVIGFSIPAGYMLPEGADAVCVLHALLESFISSFALALPDGTFEYRFSRFDITPLENICRSIPLVPSDGIRVVMKDGAPRGAIGISPEKIASMLSCLDREDFAYISELIVAEHINTSVGGISITLKDENPETEEAGEDLSEDIDISASAPEDASEAATDAGMPIRSNEESNIRNEVFHPNAKTPFDGIPEEKIASRGRRLWPTLMAGILLGAAIVYLAFCVFGRHGDVSQEMYVPADTGVVAGGYDTVAPPVRIETVFVEKKVIVEPPRSRPSAKQKEARRRAVTPSSVPPHEAVTPAAVDESTPAPVYKYDPEGERSL